MEIRVSLSGEAPEAARAAGIGGVGLVRGEFIQRRYSASFAVPEVGAHLVGYLGAVCEAFADGPVWYRCSDLWSDEAALLRDIGDISPREANPMLGCRGTRALLDNPDRFSIELALLCEVAARYPNLNLLFPFIADAEEFGAAAAFARRSGWSGRLGTMLEIPSALLDVRSLIEAGASYLLVGLNDLTCLTLGRERGSDDLKLHRSVWRLIDEVREAADGGGEWGIGGTLTPALLEAAETAGAPFATLHYAQLPALMDRDPAGFQDRDLVASIKAANRQAKAERQNNRGLRVDLL